MENPHLELDEMDDDWGNTPMTQETSKSMNRCDSSQMRFSKVWRHFKMYSMRLNCLGVVLFLDAELHGTLVSQGLS